MTDSADRFVFLCSGCAKETRFDEEQNVMEPTHESISCAHCGATLAGFFYRVPEGAYTGMAPGPG